jgi:hypothetical protein
MCTGEGGAGKIIMLEAIDKRGADSQCCFTERKCVIEGSLDQYYQLPAGIFFEAEFPGFDATHSAPNARRVSRAFVNAT